MNEQPHKEGSPELRTPDSESLAQQAKRYFPRAVLLVAFLTLLGHVAPDLPSVAIPFFLIAFSIASTIGALYHTVVHRMLRQFKYEDGGSLSHINRRWTLRMLGFLVVFLVSGLFFLLKAPGWDFFEWMMTWAAIPLYFGIYVVVQHWAQKEYRPKFRKSHAIRWSFWIVGVMLCLLYAGVSQSLTAHHYSNLAEAFSQAPNLFEHSASALMAETGWASSFTDGIANFGLARVNESSYVVGFVCHFAVYAVVFFGLVNQFSACLLSRAEIEGEFQLLPAHEERHVGPEAKSPIRMRYAVLTAIVSVATIAGFLFLNSKIEEVQVTQEHTQLVTAINEQKELFVYVADGAYAEHRETEKLVDERNAALAPLLEDYYARCKENIGAYLEWYDGATGQLARFLKRFGSPLAGDAEKTFRERVAQGADSVEIESVYQQYQEQIALVKAAYQSEIAEASPVEQPTSNVSIYVLDLWQPLNRKGTINDVLLNTEENLSREELEQKLRDLIDQAQQDTMRSLWMNRDEALVF